MPALELDELVAFYEPENPSGAAQLWRQLFQGGGDGPITLVNRFVLRERAV